MARLQELNDRIVRVTSTDEANKLVKTFLPKQAESIDKPTFGTEAGVRNCSLIAEFIIAFYSNQQVRYGERVIGRDSKPAKAGAFDLRTLLKHDPLAFVGEFGGHNIAVLREGGLYGLYQAWEGKFHVFPKLNDDGESHNIFGAGDDTITLINNEIAYLERETQAAMTPKLMIP